MKIIGYIGNGSFGTVMKVQIQGQVFALKRIPLEFDCGNDSDAMHQVQNQAHILSTCLYHPNIVRYYNSFRKNDSYFILMEYVGYRSLDDLQLPLTNHSQIANFIIQITVALNYLKKHHIIHRDIKPSNILISPKGLLKIADFGISKQVQRYAQSCLGTPYYTAPQILSQKKYDFAVDIWSFGVVLYEITHGRLPFTAKNMEGLHKKIKEENPFIISGLHPDISAILRGCLSKDPSNRMKTSQILKMPLIKRQMNQQLTQFSKYF